MTLRSEKERPRPQLRIPVLSEVENNDPRQAHDCHQGCCGSFLFPQKALPLSNAFRNPPSNRYPHICLLVAISPNLLSFLKRTEGTTNYCRASPLARNQLSPLIGNLRPA